MSLRRRPRESQICVANLEVVYNPSLESEERRRRDDSEREGSRSHANGNSHAGSPSEYVDRHQSSIDDQRRDPVVRDGEVVIERNRASRKCSGHFDANDSLGVALL
jgi:hypothetical protein